MSTFISPRRTLLNISFDSPLVVEKLFPNGFVVRHFFFVKTRITFKVIVHILYLSFN